MVLYGSYAKETGYFNKAVNSGFLVVVEGREVDLNRVSWAFRLGDSDSEDSVERGRYLGIFGVSEELGLDDAQTRSIQEWTESFFKSFLRYPMIDISQDYPVNVGK